MTEPKKGIFTMQEAKRLAIIQSVINKRRTAIQAAQELHLSERQVRRLVAAVKHDGPEGIKHGNSGNANHCKYSLKFKEHIVELKQSQDYESCNFAQFQELLEEREGIQITYPSLYQCLRAAGITSKNSHKPRKTHRSRARKSRMGTLAQTDGTPEDWFRTGEKQSLMGFIDDATGTILGLYMCQHECLAGYLEATRQMLTRFGIPKQIYSDKHSIFYSSKAQKLTIEEELAGKSRPTTQFGAIMDTLGVEMLAASTPQAKGRVERLWRTLQDRLPVEFKLNDITTIEEANRFLQEAFIDKFNKRFAVTPAELESDFVPVPDYIDLDLLLAARLTRTIDNAGKFQIQGQKFQILERTILPKSKIEILLSPKIGMKILCKGKEYHAICYSDIPNSFTNLDLVKYCKQHSDGIMRFVYDLLNEDAKRNLPLLTSS